MGFGKLSVIMVVALCLAVGGLVGCGEKSEQRAESQDEEMAPSVEQAEEDAARETTAGLGEAEPGEGGSFHVESFPPGAEIVVNGANTLERTPCSFENQIPGRYEVLVVLPGYTPTPEKHEIDVTIGSMDTLAFSMEGEPLSSFVLMQKAPKEVWPRWSPKGDLIAFEAYYESNRDIYVVPAAGGEPTRLTFDRKADFSPCWSPDGNEIAFVSGREGTIDIWAVSVSGGDPRRITDLPGAEDGPTWSPDGKWIAFEYQNCIWKIPASGGEAQQVTSGKDRHFYPSWSPDGKEIAFTAKVSDGRQLWAVNVSTGSIRKILADKGWSYAPSWSPNGKVLVFVRRGGMPTENHDLWVIPAQGGQITQLTLEGSADQYPSFSPDNKKLVWTKDGDIWVMTNLPDWLFEG